MTGSVPGPDTMIGEMLAKAALPEQIVQAFLAVPRHLFIDTLYLRQHARWERLDGADTGEWLDLVYHDEVLVTALDEQGFPASSSTAPSLMATMLELLDVRPGEHVLEIGTGTGYNAALLSHLAGPAGRVTTVDVDAALTEAAARRLGDWPNVSVVTADGWHGYEPTAPYHRIISTAGLSCLCPNWIPQLRADGVFLASLQTEYSCGLARLIRYDGAGQLSGGFVHDLPGGGFIELRSPHACGEDFLARTQAASHGIVKELSEANAGPRHLLPDRLIRLLLDAQPDFMLLIQLACPGLGFFQLGSAGSAGPQYVLVTSPQDAAVVRPSDPGPQPGYLQGSPWIAQECLRAFELWTSLGAPSVTDYTLTLSPDGTVTADARGMELAAEIYRCRTLTQDSRVPC